MCSAISTAQLEAGYVKTHCLCRKAKPFAMVVITKRRVCL